MLPIFPNPFLEALGYAIANSLWQTATLWLLYVLLSTIIKCTASVKYKMAVTAQVIGFVLFLCTVQFYYNNLSQIPTLLTTNSLLPLTEANGIRFQLMQGMVQAKLLLPYLSIAYFLLMGILGIRWISGYRRTQRIRFAGTRKIPVTWRLFVRNTAQQLGITRTIQVFLSETITTPLTIGFLKPLILIPIASINNLSTEQLEAVILHELAHIKRCDYLVNILLSVAEIMLFFNPFTQLLRKTIRVEREHSCDDWVLQFQYNASSYAEALFRLACLQPAPLLAMTASKGKSDLLVRVQRMMDQKEKGFNYPRQLLVFFLVTGILASMAWLRPATLPLPLADVPAVVQPLSPEPIKKSLVNALPPKEPILNGIPQVRKPLQKELKQEMVAANNESTRSLVKPEPPVDFEANSIKEDAAFQMVPAEVEAHKKVPFFNMEELTHQMHQVQADLKKAQADWKFVQAKSFEINDAKIIQDLEKAFEEINKMKFDQIIREATESLKTLPPEILAQFDEVKMKFFLKKMEQVQKKQIIQSLLLEKMRKAEMEINKNADTRVIELR